MFSHTIFYSLVQRSEDIWLELPVLFNWATTLDNNPLYIVHRWSNVFSSFLKVDALAVYNFLNVYWDFLHNHLWSNGLWSCISSVSCSCFLILVWPFLYTLMWLLPWRCWYGCVLVPWEIDFEPTGSNIPCNMQKTVSSILCRVGTRQEYYDMHCMLMSCTVVLFEAMTADWKKDAVFIAAC